MYERILVPTDGSEHARRAAEHGLWLSRAFDATLTVVNAVDLVREAGLFDAGGLDDEFLQRRESVAKDTVDSTLDAIGRPAAVRTDVVRGRPSEAIVEYVDEHDVDLVVMGTHGRTGINRYVAGSVAERVVRRADAPVFTVRATERSRTNDGYDDVLVPTAGSEHAAAAGEHAVAIADASGARVHVLSVVDVAAEASAVDVTPPETLIEELESAGERATDAIAARAEAAGVETLTTVTEGSAAKEILAYANERDVDLVAMGRAARSGVGRFFLGGTTAKLIARAEMPVLTVTATDQRETS